MPGLLSDNSAGQLVDLLARDLGPGVDRTVIASYVATAVQDLTGSISQEALPEMACRLARHRLSELAARGQPGDPSRMPLART